MRRYEADFRPSIEVHVGRSWQRGELRAWIRRDNDWWAYVDYLVGDDRCVTTTVPSLRIRTDDPRGCPPSAS